MNQPPMFLRIALLACAALTVSRAEEAAPFVVETADGTLIVGTLPADLELVLVRPDGRANIPAAEIRRLLVSSVSERQAQEIEAAVKGIAERWQHDEWETREAAMEEALKLPGSPPRSKLPMLSKADFRPSEVTGCWVFAMAMWIVLAAR